MLLVHDQSATGSFEHYGSTGSWLAFELSPDHKDPIRYRTVTEPSQLLIFCFLDWLSIFINLL